VSGGFDEWIVRAPIPDVVRRMEAMRQGVPGHADLRSAALAVQVLQTFALERPIADLLELELGGDGANHFHPVDATAILALAALTRPVEQAAELAIEHCEKELESAGATVLTDGIVHDVTAQRTVPEMASFIRKCRRAGQDVLVRKTLEAFAGPGSGRTSLDKALLYLALDTDLSGERCERDAAALLEAALREAAAEAWRYIDLDDEIGRPHGIVGALGHLSPTGMIVQRWVDAALAAAEQADTEAYPDRWDDVIGLVAYLLVGEPVGARGLAEHIGRTWRPAALRDLCEELVDLPNSRFATVRGYAAARPDNHELSEIIRTWWNSEKLSQQLEGLLADLVAADPAGSGGPRLIANLEGLHSTLGRDRAPRECRTMLRVAVAQHVAGRTGDEVARLLGQIADGKDIKRAAHVVNRRLTALLVAGEIDAEVMVGYLKGLQLIPRHARALTFWALRALCDPTAAVPVLEGEALGGLAARLYAEGLEQIAFDLLERHLENEQAVTARDAAEIAGQVDADPAMAGDPRWESLLAATVGRWAEAQRRDEILKELSDRGLSAAFETVIQSVQ
jgi:hypothetical protein